MSASCSLIHNISSTIPRRAAPSSSSIRSKTTPNSNYRFSTRRLRRLTTIFSSSFSSSLSSFSSSSTIADPMGKEVTSVEDPSMDAVQRRLMFDDECILVDEHDNIVGHDSKYNCGEGEIGQGVTGGRGGDRRLLGIESGKKRSPVPLPYIDVNERGFCTRGMGWIRQFGAVADCGVITVACGGFGRDPGHLMEKIEKENLLHRAFSCFLFNSKYELLLQQRSATKVTFPLVWTNACCSHPLYRESELIEENFLGVRNAAQRKLLDELGIPPEDLPVDEFIPVGRILYKAPSDGKWGEHELDYLLFVVRDVKVNPNPNEVAGVMYVNRAQLNDLLRKAKAGEDGIKLSPWFRLVVDNFLMKWWDHVEKGTLHEVSDMKAIHKML